MERTQSAEEFDAFFGGRHGVEQDAFPAADPKVQRTESDEFNDFFGGDGPVASFPQHPTGPQSPQQGGESDSLI